MCVSITCTVYPKKYAHGFIVLCFVVVMQSFIMNSQEVFIHIHQGCFAGTGAIVRLPQCQWSKPDGYGKISQCITTTKDGKAKTVCIFLGISVFTKSRQHVCHVRRKIQMSDVGFVKIIVIWCLRLPIGRRRVKSIRKTGIYCTSFIFIALRVTNKTLSGQHSTSVVSKLAICHRNFNGRSTHSKIRKSSPRYHMILDGGLRYWPV